MQLLLVEWFSLHTREPISVSTTVVNPSIWMPTYNESPWNAAFFVLFNVVTIFYVHSLVLSVVFQVFIQSATEVHRRSASEKVHSLKTAFLALASAENNPNTNTGKELPRDANKLVDVRLICETLRLVRPHYSQQKLNVLMEMIVSPNLENGSQIFSQMERKRDDDGEYNNKRIMDFDEFRKKMQQVLSSSIRATRTHSASGLVVEIFSISISIVNFVFVMIFTSPLHPNHKNDNVEFIVGSIITALVLFEVSLRYNMWKYSNRINPITRFNAILDGMGCVGGIVSFFGTLFVKLAKQQFIRS